jgi:hypothetical protein
MILHMRRRLIAAFVIVGWISLSGFDVVEDLDEAPGKAALSRGFPDASAGSKRGGWGPLANNIIESANGIEQIKPAFVSSAATFVAFRAASDSRRHFQLHKLYRIFLI